MLDTLVHGGNLICIAVASAKAAQRTVKGLRYHDLVATAINRDELHDALDQSVIVIDAEDLERSRRDPKVRALHESAEQLLVELESEGAEYS
jgi:hypothetical protein